MLKLEKKDGIIVLLSLALIVLFVAAWQAEQENTQWFHEYMGQYQDITRSGCHVYPAREGGAHYANCTWQPVDPLAFGCGWYWNGSAATDCAALMRGEVE